jgi:hypothetical protein
VAARTVAAAHQAHTAAAAAHQARTAAAPAVVVHTQAAQVAAAQVAAAQVAAAQPFLHFCGSACGFCADQLCDLASRCATVQAAPLQSASPLLVCKTAGAAS